MSKFTMEVYGAGLRVTAGKTVEDYSLTVAPERNSLLVQDEKQNILGSINLEKMLLNLDDCVDLLQITYNAVNGMKVLHASVAKLQVRMADTLLCSNETVRRFDIKTKTAINKYIDAYGCLLDADEESAVEELAEIAKDAGIMKDEAEKLQKRFEDISKDTEEVLYDVIKQNSDNYKQKEEIEEATRAMQAKVDAIESTKASLAAEIADLNQQYGAMLKRQETAEERSFWVSIVGALASGLGAGLQAFGNGSGSGSAGGSGGSGGASSGTNTTPAIEDMKNDVKKKTDDKKSLESDIGGLDKSIEEIDKKLTTEEDDSKKEALKTEKQNLVSQKTTKEDAFKAAGAALTAVSQSLTEAQATLAKFAENAKSQLDNIFAQQQALKKLERENLAALAEYTKKIENAVITKDSLQTAITSLITAIGCLRRVISYLKEMVQFWSVIKLCCEALTGTEITDKIIRIERKYNKLPNTPENLQNRTATYKEFGFMSVFLAYLVRWVALNEVCVDYLAALHEVQSRLNKTIAEPEMQREEHWKQASSLAKTLSTKLGVQLLAEEN